MVLLIPGICLHDQMLSTQLFGRLFPGISSAACETIDPTAPYLYLFFVHWPIIQVIFVSIIPVLLILTSAISIHHLIHKKKQHIQSIGINNGERARQA
ncbi:unnamed protein product, partial [Rotaria sp. Silwood1]